MPPRHVEVIHRRRLKQKWYARFIADNGLVLARTEHSNHLGDVITMLEEYFPDWSVKVIS